MHSRIHPWTHSMHSRIHPVVHILKRDSCSTKKKAAPIANLFAPTTPRTLPTFDQSPPADHWRHVSSGPYRLCLHHGRGSDDSGHLASSMTCKERMRRIDFTTSDTASTRPTEIHVEYKYGSNEGR